MPHFTFYTLSERRAVPDFEFIWCETQEEAVRQAKMILMRDPEIQTVEIFDGAAWRETVNRGGRNPPQPGPPLAPS